MLQRGGLECIERRKNNFEEYSDPKEGIQEWRRKLTAGNFKSEETRVIVRWSTILFPRSPPEADRCVGTTLNALPRRAWERDLKNVPPPKHEEIVSYERQRIHIIRIGEIQRDRRLLLFAREKIRRARR